VNDIARDGRLAQMFTRANVSWRPV
jgi:hypothetical protein